MLTRQTLTVVQVCPVFGRLESGFALLKYIQDIGGLPESMQVRMVDGGSVPRDAVRLRYGVVSAFLLCHLFGLLRVGYQRLREALGSVPRVGFGTQSTQTVVDEHRPEHSRPRCFCSAVARMDRRLNGSDFPTRRSRVIRVR